MKKNNRKNTAEKTVKAKKNYAEIYEDGWADDVTLHYPKGRWRPSNAEEDDLVIQDFDVTKPLPVLDDPSSEYSDSAYPEEESFEDDSYQPEDDVYSSSTPGRHSGRASQSSPRHNSVSQKRNTASHPSKKETVAQPDKPSKKGKKKRKKGSAAYRIFMYLWLGTIAIIMALELDRFYEFLEKYEETWQISRPYHEMERLFSTYFETRDMESIYNMLSVKPEVGPFETEEDVKTYMYSLMDGKELSYKQSENYNDELPEYYIEADGYIIGKALFRKDPAKTLDYQFPVWYLSELEYYTQPMEQFRVTVPDHYTVLVNGIELDDTYLTGTTPISVEREYFDPYIGETFEYKDYQGDGFYLKPEVTILNEKGNVPENLYADTENNIYSAEYEPDPADREAMEKFAIDAVSAYAMYISQDLSDAALEQYFTPNNKYVYYAKNNSSRTFYTRHSSVSIENVEVRDFQIFSDDAYYCEIYLEQWMKLAYGGSEPEVVPTDCRFYIVKYNGEWKVNGIKF